MRDVSALRRAERARRDLLANVSHELRTPLTSVRLLAESIASGTVEDGPTVRDFASQIERETDRLATLVDELLDLGRIETGETSLALEAVDPGAVVATCVERIRPTADRRRISVGTLPGTVERARAVADPARLEQALLNLAHNAVKFSHPGGEIRIGWSVAGGRVRFTVADDGIGVPAAHQARIFERFYKVDRARARADVEDGPRPRVPASGWRSFGTSPRLTVARRGQARSRGSVRPSGSRFGEPSSRPDPSAISRNARTSLRSSTSLLTGLPTPWPASVSTRSSTGAADACAAWSAAANLNEWPGNHPVVVVTGRDQGRRVRDTIADVVERRVGQEGAELVRVVGRAVVAGPCPPDREAMEPEHVHHPDLGDRRTEQLGVLGDAGTDKEPAVRPPTDANAVSAGPVRCGEPSRDGGEVVEDVLLVGEAAGIVPLAAVLPAAAQRRHGEQAAALHEREPLDLEGGADRDLEAAIPVEEGWHVAGRRDVAAVGQEDGESGAVVGRHERLRGHERIGIPRHAGGLHFSEPHRPASRRRGRGMVP